MRKFTQLCVWLLVQLGIIQAQAVGTIQMSSVASHMAIYYDTFGNTHADTQVYAEIMSNIGDGAVWMAVISATTGSSILKVDESGIFDGDVGYVPTSTDNALVSFYVRAWSGTPTYDSSIQLGKNGISAIWQQTTGAWDQMPGTTPTGPALELSSPVIVQIHPMPEPSTIALMALATPMLLAALRKTGRP